MTSGKRMDLRLRFLVPLLWMPIPLAPRAPPPNTGHSFERSCFGPRKYRLICRERSALPSWQGRSHTKHCITLCHPNSALSAASP